MGIVGPNPAAMCFNDGARYRKAYPHSCFLYRNESIKDSFRALGSRADINQLDQYLVHPTLRGPNLDTRQNWPTFHRVDFIRNQVDEDLLNLDRVHKEACSVFIDGRIRFIPCKPTLLSRGDAHSPL